VPVFDEGHIHLKSEPADLDASGYDIVVIVTDHTQFDYSRILNSAPVIFDTRAVTRKLKNVPMEKVIRL
jgi:UDP-N-acetyl-D-mannosaminuronate dehydrogenase